MIYLLWTQGFLCCDFERLHLFIPVTAVVRSFHVFILLSIIPMDFFFTLTSNSAQKKKILKNPINLLCHPLVLWNGKFQIKQVQNIGFFVFPFH